MVFALLWNLRFTLAYLEFRGMSRALLAGDIDKAATLSAAASNHVPENKDLQLFASYYSAIVLLRDDNN